ncbi:Hypothetical protein R9X50_00587300 [Acrodontium crateriforme]|uniref:Uncharacterized protein n=1 Tax=Acrodontium crateriforme TaxID=150365 RepID=A0AAQ3R9G8_9PEZI|nr:Hypothetical protein R9X50_00587300 [Acrodontium crateriforme]
MATINCVRPLHYHEEDGASENHPGVTPRKPSTLNKGPESCPSHRYKRRRSTLHNGDAPFVEKLCRSDSFEDVCLEEVKNKHQNCQSFEVSKPPRASPSTSISDDEISIIRSHPSDRPDSLGPYKLTLDSIRVQPPLHNAMMKPKWQWTSRMYHSSRPKIPFGWCKRWRCGDCKAETIMEQRVCSRLTCLHRRCVDCVAHCLVLPRSVMADQYSGDSILLDEGDDE